MRRLFASAVCAGLLFGFVPASAAADDGLRARADRVMRMTYDEFGDARHVRPFDWSTDGCSHPLADPDMTPACEQHDFGYRNYGERGKLRLGPDAATREWIDRRFLTEMHRICGDLYKRGTSDRSRCDDNAELMHTAVRLFGGAHY